MLCLAGKKKKRKEQKSFHTVAEVFSQALWVLFMFSLLRKMSFLFDADLMFTTAVQNRSDLRFPQHRTGCLIEFTRH